MAVSDVSALPAILVPFPGLLLRRFSPTQVTRKSPTYPAGAAPLMHPQTELGPPSPSVVFVNY
jgi:hypothetical protein